MQLCEAFEPPQPLLEYQQAPLPYPAEALGDLLGPAVERLAEVIGVPCAMAAQSVLASAALVSQGHANVQLDGRTYPLSLYLLTVASSGDRKSAVDHLALKAARDWERQQWTLYAEKLKTYRAASSLMTKPKTAKKHAETEGSELSEPVPPRLIIAEPTIEALVKSLCQGLPSMGLFNDEGGQFLGSSTMSKENLLKAITTLSTLWDGSPIDRARSMAGESLRAYDRRLSLHLMLQPYLANQLFKDPVINGQGILGRCLISWPERLAGQRLYKAIDLTRDTKVQRYQQRITALLQKPWSLHKDGSLNPVTLELTAPARRAWIDIHDTIECQSGEFGELAGVQPVASKAAANVLRIAGVLAMVEEASTLDEAHIQRASTLMDYYLSEIQRLTEQEPVNSRCEEADRLLRWLVQKSWTHFSIRDVNRNGPRFARKSADHTASLLVVLITHRWLSSRDGKLSRSAMFRLNDAVRRYQAQHQSQPESRRVAASVATLSPRARPETTRVVATVAAVATPPLELTNLALLIEQLREEGALLQHHENAFLIRPTHWQQMDRLSPHWKALLLFLQTNENGDDDGLGRST